ncbi:MAG: hypothetical protein ACM3XM_15630 [Mycobacterium leprae]
MSKYTVILIKESETETEVVYRFGPNEAHMGRLKMEKKTGSVYEMDEVPVEHPGAFFTCGAYKLLAHRAKGEYPDMTSLAS